ncbi:MAG: hypothetical protein NZ551_08805 [Microscillaceae bacterium]|nr:hypothetical protein [Microscillaceae bacterium]MDW8461299.1 hypothetical protein [Cytophagales bacterium]
MFYLQLFALLMGIVFWGACSKKVEVRPNPLKEIRRTSNQNHLDSLANSQEFRELLSQIKTFSDFTTIAFSQLDSTAKAIRIAKLQALSNQAPTQENIANIIDLLGFSNAEYWEELNKIIYKRYVFYTAFQEVSAMNSPDLQVMFQEGFGKLLTLQNGANEQNPCIRQRDACQSSAYAHYGFTVFFTCPGTGLAFAPLISPLGAGLYASLCISGATAVLQSDLSVCQANYLVCVSSSH